MEEKILFGTYTSKASKGIYSGTLDPVTAKVHDIKNIATLDNPTYLTTDDNGGLYSIIKRGNEAGVASYVYDANSGTAQLKSTVLASGPAPCYVAYDATKHLLFSANYHTADIKLYRVAADHTLTLCDTLHRCGHGPRPEQQSAHLHYVDLAPDSNLIAVDLGSDQLLTLHVADDRLILDHVTDLPAGFGPRHIVFKDEATAYVVGELSSQVALLHYSNGRFTIVATYATIPASWQAHNGAAAIRISADKKFLYVSNRGYNSIAVFAITANNQLHLIQNANTAGDFPRDFALDSTGKFLLVAHQNSDNLTLFRRDPATGLLRQRLWHDTTLPQGVCVHFIGGNN